MRFIVTIFFTLIASLTHAWNLNPLGGEKSPYSESTQNNVGKIKMEFSKQHELDTKLMDLICLENAEEKNYIGLGQFMLVKAPLSSVTETLESFAKYPKWFQGLVKNIVQPQDKKSEFLVSSEQLVPLPFIENIKTTMIYTIQKLEKQVLFRYQLKSSNTLIHYDGMIELQELTPGEVAFVEYDYILADWGLGKMLGSKSIWTETLKGIVQTDLAIKLRVENVAFTDQEVKNKSSNMVDKVSILECIKNRHKNPN